MVRGQEEMNIGPRPWPLLGPWAFSAESWAPSTVVGGLGTPEGLRCAPERTSLPTPSSCFLVRRPSPTSQGVGRGQDLFQSLLEILVGAVEMGCRKGTESRGPCVSGTGEGAGAGLGGALGGQMGSGLAF